MLSIGAVTSNASQSHSYDEEEVLIFITWMKDNDFLNVFFLDIEEVDHWNFGSPTISVEYHTFTLIDLPFIMKKRLS